MRHKAARYVSFHGLGADQEWGRDAQDPWWKRGGLDFSEVLPATLQGTGSLKRHSKSSARNRGAARGWSRERRGPASGRGIGSGTRPGSVLETRPQPPPPTPRPVRRGFDPRSTPAGTPPPPPQPPRTPTRP